MPILSSTWIYSLDFYYLLVDCFDVGSQRTPSVPLFETGVTRGCRLCYEYDLGFNFFTTNALSFGVVDWESCFTIVVDENEETHGG